jgi:hypothetical protein
MILPDLMTNIACENQPGFAVTSFAHLQG